MERGIAKPGWGRGREMGLSGLECGGKNIFGFCDRGCDGFGAQDGATDKMFIVN